jgi:hypothetical protein
MIPQAHQSQPDNRAFFVGRLWLCQATAGKVCLVQRFAFYHGLLASTLWAAARIARRSGTYTNTFKCSHECVNECVTEKAYSNCRLPCWPVADCSCGISYFNKIHSIKVSTDLAIVRVVGFRRKGRMKKSKII